MRLIFDLPIMLIVTSELDYSIRPLFNIYWFENTFIVALRWGSPVSKTEDQSRLEPNQISLCLFSFTFF